MLAREIARFGTVGALAFVLDTLLYNLFVFGLPGAGEGPLAHAPLLAKTASMGIATVFSWLANRFWTFRHRVSRTVAREFALFVFFNIVGLGIALACLGISRYALGLDSQLADNISGNGIGLVLGTLFRFWAYRTFVFTGETAGDDEALPEASDPDAYGVSASGR